MSARTPRELLDELRTYLQHFEESGHIGDRTDVAEITRRLRARIVEVEAEMKRGSRNQDPSERAPDRP